MQIDRESLIAKFGYDQAAEIIRGLATVEHRRSELAFNHRPDPRQVRPVPITVINHFPPLPDPFPDPPVPPPQPNHKPSEAELLVKIQPVPGMVAIKAKLGGAWRLWSLAHLVDKNGSGKVSRAELFGFLDRLDVDERQRRRWIAEALRAGLIRQDGKNYYLAGLARMAAAVGSASVGLSAWVRADDLVRPGWRGLVWSGYLCTLGPGAVISQDTKAEITGVDPRTQRNYQASQPGQAIINLAERGYTKRPAEAEKLVAGLADVSGRPYFVTHEGRIFQRLPDSRIVPTYQARAGKWGRSRKAQAVLNFSLLAQRDPEQPRRLFYKSEKAIRRAVKRLQDIVMRPGELFQKLIEPRRRAHLWQPVFVTL